MSSTSRGRGHPGPQRRCQRAGSRGFSAPLPALSAAGLAATAVASLIPTRDFLGVGRHDQRESVPTSAGRASLTAAACPPAASVGALRDRSAGAIARRWQRSRCGPWDRGCHRAHPRYLGRRGPGQAVPAVPPGPALAFAIALRCRPWATTSTSTPMLSRDSSSPVDSAIARRCQRPRHLGPNRHCHRAPLRASGGTANTGCRRHPLGVLANTGLVSGVNST